MTVCGQAGIKKRSKVRVAKWRADEENENRRETRRLKARVRLESEHLQSHHPALFQTLNEVNAWSYLQNEEQGDVAAGR